MNQYTVTKQVLSFFFFLPDTEFVAGDTKIRMTVQPRRQLCTYMEGKEFNIY